MYVGLFGKRVVLTAKRKDADAITHVCMGEEEKTEANVDEGMVCVLGRERHGIKSPLVTPRS